MGLYRHLAQLMAVMIVVIIAGFLPSAAHAHGGHEHGAAVSAQYAEAGPSTTAATKADVVRSAVVTASAHSQPGDRACNGFCCGSSMACCSPAVMPESVTLRAPRASVRLGILPDAPVLPGTNPEALPKPPRSFA